MIDKGIVYLEDSNYLNLIKELIKNYDGPFLEIGPGKGSITKLIPEPKILVERDLRHEPYLKKETIIWSDIEKVKDLPNVKTCVSNLPYGGGIGILVHCIRTYPSIEKYLVILQKELVEKILYTKSLLHHKMNHLFQVKSLFEIPSQAFNPTPLVNGWLIQLTPKKVDWDYFNFLRQIRHPRKKLKSNGLDSPLRLDQLSYTQLRELYLKSKLD